MLEPKDLPHNRKFEEDISNFENLFSLNKLFSKIGLGSSKLSELENEIQKFKEQHIEMTYYPTMYNRYFSKKGWIAHDSMDFTIIKHAVDLFDDKKEKEAEEVIKEYYNPTSIESRIIYLRAIPEFQPRMKFIEYALQDYKDERYYSVIPILLMTIDGIINDITQKGFHSKDLNLDVWDSITSTDSGIKSIKEIFTKTRRKTTTDVIDLPYRNGILHGRDLAYDNFTVACKSWAVLFFVRDWITTKKSEKDRLDSFVKKNKPTSWKELKKSLLDLEKLKIANAAWEPRNITTDYISKLNLLKIKKSNEPEFLIIEYLNYWISKNYGKMAESFSELITDNYRKHAAEVRKSHQDLKLYKYTFIDITDEASAISEIMVSLVLLSNEILKVKFRCIYERGRADSLPRGFEGGRWKIVWMQKL